MKPLKINRGTQGGKMLELDLVPRSPAYQHLVELARNGETTNYQGLAKALSIDLGEAKERSYLSHILELISRFEVEHERPMLSAIVLGHNKSIPNDGFFALARELGLQRTNDNVAFHSAMLQAVFQLWRDW